MKIIKVDNYDRESVSDTLICENIDIYYGERFCNMLNKPKSRDYFKCVEDDYKLYEFKP